MVQFSSVRLRPPSLSRNGDATPSHTRSLPSPFGPHVHKRTAVLVRASGRGPVSRSAVVPACGQGPRSRSWPVPAAENPVPGPLGDRVWLGRRPPLAQLRGSREGRVSVFWCRSRNRSVSYDHIMTRLFQAHHGRHDRLRPSRRPWRDYTYSTTKRPTHHTHMHA